MKDIISNLINLMISVLIASIIVSIVFVIIGIFVDINETIESISALICLILSCFFYTIIQKKKNFGLLIVNKIANNNKK